MGALFRVIWQIAILRQGPQGLPASSALLWLALTAHWLTGVVLELYSLPFDSAVISAMVGTLIMVALVHTLLVLHRLQHRFVQTVTALAACEALLSVIAIPIYSGIMQEGSVRDISAMFYLLLLGWYIAIAAHIFRHALKTSMGMGVLFAIGYTLISISLVNVIGPAAS